MACSRRKWRRRTRRMATPWTECRRSGRWWWRKKYEEEERNERRSTRRRWRTIRKGGGTGRGHSHRLPIVIPNGTIPVVNAENGKI